MEDRVVGAAVASMLLHAAVAAWLLIPTAEPAVVPDTVAVDLVPEEPATASEPATGDASEEPTPPAATPAPPALDPPPPEGPATEAPPPVATPASVPVPTPSRKPRVPAAAAPPKPAATGAPSPATPGTAPAAVPPDHAATDYAATINGRLERSKIYPRLARVRREEGAAQVRFTVAPDGTVTACALTASSGHELLDEEACALVHRASPLPPPPGAAPNTRLDMSAPIRFSMTQSGF